MVGTVRRMEANGSRRCCFERWAMIAVALLIGVPSLANARTETLRWQHPTPDAVAGYRVHWGSSSGNYTNTRNAGKPASVDGIVTWDLTNVPDDATIYVAVTAYDAQGIDSGYSNEKVRVGSTTPDPEPDPVPEPDPTVPAEANWVQDFEVSSLGTNLPAWIDTGAFSSLVEDDLLFQVTDLGGDRVLTTSSGDTDIHSHLVTTESETWTSYEVRARMRVSSTDSRLGVNAYSQFVDQAALYRLSSAWSSGELEIHGMPWDGSSKSCASKGTGVIPQPGIWYEVRFQVIPQSGSNLLRAKAWPVGASEPTSWQAQCTDTAVNRPVAGTIGVWSSRGGSKYWDDFSVVPVDGGVDPVPADGEEELGAPGQPFLVFP